MQRRITTVALTSFSTEQLRETVRGSDFEHTQLSDGPFRGRLLRSQFGDSVLDAGSYSRDLLARGTFPADRVVLGYILTGGEAGYFNGMRLAVHDVIVIGEGGAMEPYRLPAGTQWIAFQTRRDLLEREGIPVPAPARMVRYSGLSPEALQLGQYLAALIAPGREHRPKIDPVRARRRPGAGGETHRRVPSRNRCLAGQRPAPASTPPSRLRADIATS